MASRTGAQRCFAQLLRTRRASLPRPPPRACLAQTRACTLDARTRVLRNSKVVASKCVGSWKPAACVRWLVALLRHWCSSSAPLCIFGRARSVCAWFYVGCSVGDTRTLLVHMGVAWCTAAMTAAPYPIADRDRVWSCVLVLTRNRRPCNGYFAVRLAVRAQVRFLGTSRLSVSALGSASGLWPSRFFARAEARRA